MRGSPVPLRKAVPCLLALAFVSTALAGCMETTPTGPDDPTSEESSDAGSRAGTGTGTEDGSETTDPSSGGDGSDGGRTTWSAPASGRLLVFIKDAPTDHFSEIWVNVTAVEVHLAPGSANSTSDDGNETDGDETMESEGGETAGSDGNETTESNGNETTEYNGNETTESNGNETTESNGNETAGDGGGNASRMNGGWIDVVNYTRSIDLLSFSDPDSKAFLGDAVLTAGRYTQIRLHISDAWGIRTEDGAREEIQLANHVAKIVRSFQIDPDASTEIVIDVDLDRSVRSYGPPHAPHGWRMTPVIGKVLVDPDPEDATEDVPDSE